jgi:hypothetical protein
VVALALVVECAAFYVIRQGAVNRHNANINRIKNERWGRGAPTGQAWYDADDNRLRYAVLHGGPDAAPGKAGEINVPVVDLSRPFSEGKVWLNFSRTERVRVNLGPPQLTFCLAGVITTTPLPPGFTKADLEDFMQSAESRDGVPGFQRWLARRR